MSDSIVSRRAGSTGRTRSAISALVGWLVVAATILACSGDAPPAPREIRNVLLISLDTLRADHMGVYGFARDTTPNLDALARDGVVFRNAISSAPITLPSHSTLLTGKYPPAHGVHDNNTAGLSAAHTTLAEVLKAEGFVTEAIVSGVPLAARYGLDQGFDGYQDDFESAAGRAGRVFLERSAEQSVARAIAFVREQRDNRFFLFLHLFDPHDQYAPPSPWREEYADDPYAGEIAYADDALGELLRDLERLGLYDSTLIVFVSDHGESLGQHGELGHTFFIYQATQHVPLIIRAPGAPSGIEVDSLVGLVDVMPSVLGLLDIAPPEAMEGFDLSAEVRGEEIERADRTIYCESLVPTKVGCNPLLGVVGKRWKYIHTTRPELYDLSRDPAEEVDLAQRESGRRQVLQASLEAHLSRARPGQQVDFEVDPETQRALAALGYFGGAVEERLEIDPTRNDPKDYVGFFGDVGRVVALTRAGKLRRARTLATQLSERRPDMADLYRLLGQIDLQEKRGVEAAAHFETYLSLAEHVEPAERADEATDPVMAEMRRDQYAEVLIGLAAALSMQGRDAEAERPLLAALELRPGSLSAHLSLARVLSRLGQLERATAQYREVLRLDPAHAEARAALREQDQPGGIPQA